jgi:hypothetical protein
MVVIKQRHFLGSCIFKNGFKKVHLISNILHITHKNKSNFAHCKLGSFMMPIF